MEKGSEEQSKSQRRSLGGGHEQTRDRSRGKGVEGRGEAGRSETNRGQYENSKLNSRMALVDKGSYSLLIN